jgi:hypothetical protein
MLTRAPFTPQAVRWKVQAQWSTGGLIVAYVDARLVVERLNLLLGSNWSDAYEPTSAGLMWCHLTLGSTTRSDVGEGKGKALVSDALKRAAVKFGVAVSLYALPQMTMNVGELLSKRERPGKEPILTITEKGVAVLREHYANWLQGPGATFGEPFDHGDVDDSQGDVDLEATAEEEPLSLPQQTDVTPYPRTEEEFETALPVSTHEPAPSIVRASVNEPALPVGVEPNPQGDLGEQSDADIARDNGGDDLDRLRVEIKELLVGAGDDLADQRIRGAGTNLGALRDLHRFALKRAGK